MLTLTLGTGFLTASCTDQSYASGECTEHCADNPVPDVIYNPDTGLWACCGWSYENGVDCANPTSETWAAPAPQVLLNAASSSNSITGTATSSIASSSSTATSHTSFDSSTITSTATLQPTSSSSSSASSSTSSPGLSTGAKVGIAIGVIALFALIALGVFFVWSRGRKPRRRHVQAEEVSAAPIYESDRPQKNWTQQSAAGSKYRDYSPPAVEMHSKPTNELPANAPARQGGAGRGLVELQ